MTGQHRPPRRWFRAPRGRTGQPEQGRHSEYYVATHQGRGVGMFPVGHAGRESLEGFLAAPAHRNA